MVQNLFPQDLQNDELTRPDDRRRLCTWNVISEAELAPVLAATEADDFGGRDAARTVADAKNLVRWCLQVRAVTRTLRPGVERGERCGLEVSRCAGGARRRTPPRARRSRRSSRAPGAASARRRPCTTPCLLKRVALHGGCAVD